MTDFAPQKYDEILDAMEGLSVMAFQPAVVDATLSSCGLTEDEVGRFKSEVVWLMLKDLSITAAQTQALIMIADNLDETRALRAAKDLALAGAGARSLVCSYYMSKDGEILRESLGDRARRDGAKRGFAPGESPMEKHLARIEAGRKERLAKKEASSRAKGNQSGADSGD